jgi:hypothetical protein
MIHHSDWDIRMTHGRPEFLPPGYLDPNAVKLGRVVGGGG